MTRRTVLRAAGIAAGWTIVPRAVLGGQGQTPPSDRVTLACVGVGAQGLRVMMDFITHGDTQVVAVCDVNKGSDDFNEWGQFELRNKVRALVGSSTWGDTATYRPMRHDASSEDRAGSAEADLHSHAARYRLSFRALSRARSAREGAPSDDDSAACRRFESAYHQGWSNPR